MEHFFAYTSRMRFISRWALMRNSQPENIQEHSHQVAVLAHALAVIRNRCFGGQVDPGTVAVAALYHDASEILTGDLPTPIKYYNPAIRDAYKHKCQLMLSEMKKQLPPYVKFTIPEGGMFIWAELPENIDATALLDTAVDHGVAYVPGEYFYANEEESKKNTMRLNYTIMSDEQIITGVKRLAEVIKTVCKD